MQVSLGSISVDNLIGYLNKIKESKYLPYQIGGDIWFHDDAWNDPIHKEAFRRLSTCKNNSCTCTGYQPKENCPDMGCFCNK